MNKVFMMGRLTRNPEISYAGNGKAIVRYTLAVDRDYPDGEDGIKTDFFKCVAYDREAEFARDYLVQGQKILIFGSIRNVSFIGRDGNQVRYSEIKVKSQEFAGGKRKKDLNKSSPEPLNRNFDDLDVDENGFLRVPENIGDGIPFL